MAVKRTAIPAQIVFNIILGRPRYRIASRFRLAELGACALGLDATVAFRYYRGGLLRYKPETQSFMNRHVAVP
jgi:hypothetical protein